MKRQIETKIINPMLGRDYPLPAHATDGSAGLDLRACIDKPLTLEPGDTTLIGSGIAIHINDTGIMAVIVARSGLGVKHGIVISQACGIVDSDFGAEILVPLWNRSKAAFTIQPGERICQMIFVPVIQAELVVVDEFSASSGRGAGGFGHTGRH